MTDISIQELVRKDLLWAEQQGLLPEPYVGPEALLDAYESCLELACYIRQVIEDLRIGSQVHRRARERKA